MSLDLTGEIDEVTRIAIDFSQRHDVPLTKGLAYHRRKAELLTAIADRRRDDQEARKVAANAWQQVRDLEAAQ